MEEFRKEPATLTLIIINIVVFLMVEFTGLSQDTLHMLDWGAAYTPLIVEKGEVYRLFTSMFLHFGLYHLLNNMALLLFLGDTLEELVGRWRYLVIYLGGGIIGNLLSMLWDCRTGFTAVSAGASGAVFAVIGGVFVILLKNRGRIEQMTASRLLFVIVLTIYHGFQSAGVDNAAHIGGVLGGALLTALLYRRRTISQVS